MANFFTKKLRHYFVPHESNNFRARSLHNSAIIFYILLLIVFQFSLKVVRQVKPDILGYATDISVEKIITLVNQKRTEANLQPLSLSDQLSIAATAKGNDMFAKDYWAHVSPTGTTPWAFINASGYQYVYAGENLARNFNTAGEVVTAWMNSPTHRANILKPEYKDIGLAVINGRLNGEDTTLVVEEFGTLSKPAVAEVLPTAQPKQTVLADNRQPAEVQIPQSQGFLILPGINKAFSLVIAEFLLVVLFIDSLYLWKFKTHRLSGHSLAHIIFLGALIGAMGATGIGVIL